MLVITVIEAVEVGRCRNFILIPELFIVVCYLSLFNPFFALCIECVINGDLIGLGISDIPNVIDMRIINLDALTYAGNLESMKDLEYDERHIFVHGNICDATLVA